MGIRNLRACLEDLKRHGRLIEVTDPVDPYLEVAEIQRRVYRSGGPALWFTNVAGCSFSLASNLFGTLDRARFMFRDTIEDVRRAIQLKVDPSQALRQPWAYRRAPWIAWQMRPKSIGRGPVLSASLPLAELPQVTSWPDDGGPFVTLPQVYSEDPRDPRLTRSNLGMYRIQLAGNQYDPQREVGLHYQIHRGIGVHHQAALQLNQPFSVNVFVGGHPAMTLAAVMPLPEGMSELTFAGALAGHRIPMIRRKDGASIYAEADFCLEGVVDPRRTLPEGPFGDHLGYYSLQHDFPVLSVKQVHHRRDAIWPLTVVGRPPQEDTVFGELIHELTGPVIPTVLPGIRQVNAVDAAGVHPLLLAIGSERYVPYQATTEPQELLTQANAVLGQGQMSLAKYLWILDGDSAPGVSAGDIESFLMACLERVDWKRDLHFQTQTTIDTLDYSGSGFNRGSKLVVAAAGPARRTLPTELPSQLALPDGFGQPQLCIPGVLAIQGPAWETSAARDGAVDRFCREESIRHGLNEFPLVVIVDDSQFTAANLNNFLWTVFTRSSPARDVHGLDSETTDKHWGCRGSLVIDARIKPHHAPPLVEDLQVTARVDALAARGGPLAPFL